MFKEAMEKIKEIRELQATYVKLTQEIDEKGFSTSEAVENAITERLKKEFTNEFSVHATVLAGQFHNGECTIDVCVSNVDGAFLTDEGWKKTETVKRVEEDFDWDDYVDVPVEVDIDVDKLKEVCEEIGKELDIKCELYQKSASTWEIRKENLRAFKDAKSLRAYFEDRNLEIVKSGEIEYKGWDIADQFHITKIDGNYVLFLSTNEHGFGIDHVFDFTNDVENLTFFFDRIEEDEVNENLREKYFDKILENWKNAQDSNLKVRTKEENGETKVLIEKEGKVVKEVGTVDERECEHRIEKYEKIEALKNEAFEMLRNDMF